MVIQSMTKEAAVEQIKWMVSCDGEKLSTCNNVNAKRIFWSQDGQKKKKNWKNASCSESDSSCCHVVGKPTFIKKT